MLRQAQANGVDMLQMVAMSQKLHSRASGEIRCSASNAEHSVPYTAGVVVQCQDCPQAVGLPSLLLCTCRPLRQFMADACQSNSIFYSFSSTAEGQPYVCLDSDV